MKTITFLRHSKSSWDTNLEDIDRPLNDIGVKKIKKVAKLSNDQFSNCEIIFSSSANRAIHTSLILTRELSIESNKIRIYEDLYTFNFKVVFDFITKIENVTEWSKYVIDNFESISMVINNAGMACAIVPIEALNAQQAENCIKFNVMGMFYISQAFLSSNDKYETKCI